MMKKGMLKNIGVFFGGNGAAGAVFALVLAALSGGARAAITVNPPTPLSGSSPPTVQAGVCPNTGWCTSFVTCEQPGTAQMVSDYLIQDLLANLANMSATVESWLYGYMNSVIQSAYDQQQWIELQMTQGWDTFWYYDLQPGLQSMTRQLDADLAQQAFQLQAGADATATMSVNRALASHEQKDRGINGGGQMCVAATMSEGFVRTKSFAHDMRIIWERDSLADGLNEKDNAQGTLYPGASSAVGSESQQWFSYINFFCDPDGNSGKNYCPNATSAAPGFVPMYNADVEPVRWIYNDLTIPMDQADNPFEGAEAATAVYDIINNMVGIPAEEPMTKPALSSPLGHQAFLRRRSYLARYAAVRSVPDLIASWRVPGSGAQLAAEVHDLRVAAGAPDTGYNGPQSLVGGYISRDPSYKEIMHAVSVDQFNTGKFALGMITNKNKLQMEKLNLSVFYLMQLRDYYELLERTALVLAVQVSVRDQQKMNTLQNVYKAAPLN